VFLCGATVWPLHLQSWWPSLIIGTYSLLGVQFLAGIMQTSYLNMVDSYKILFHCRFRHGGFQYICHHYVRKYEKNVCVLMYNGHDDLDDIYGSRWILCDQLGAGRDFKSEMSAFSYITNLVGLIFTPMGLAQAYLLSSKARQHRQFIATGYR